MLLYLRPCMFRLVIECWNEQRVEYEWRPARCSTCSTFEDGITWKYISPKQRKKKVWKVKEKPNTKEQLLTIGDAVKEKTAAKTQVCVMWNSRLQKRRRKRSQNPLVPRLEEMSLLQIYLREKMVSKIWRMIAVLLIQGKRHGRKI